MNILVTGGTGLIGRNLIKRLKGNIYVMARNQTKLLQLKKEFPHIIIIVGDIANERQVIKALHNIHIVYHLAALRAVGKAEKKVINCINTNIVGTMNLLKHFMGDKFITLSTDKSVNPNSIYGTSKFMMEGLIKEYQRLYTWIDYYVIRSGNVFGSTDSVIDIWKDKLQNREEIDVTDLEATRYFCTVK